MGRFAVGGGNEMRAAFERFLVLRNVNPVNNDFDREWVNRVTNPATRNNFPEHPCLNGDWPAGRETIVDSAGDNLTGAGGQGVTYLSDFRDSYYTLLKGKTSAPATTKECGDMLQEFVSNDFMVQAFLGGSCKGLAQKVKKWKLISSIFHSFKDVGGIRDGASLKDAWKRISGWEQTGTNFSQGTYPVPLKAIPRIEAETRPAYVGYLDK